MAKEDKSALINKAVAAIRAGEFTDYSKAAARFGVDRTSVSKRVRGLTKPRQEANSLYLQCLTTAQEEVLIGYINKLTDQGMPPTSHIVKNLAEEIRGYKVRKN
jgi:exonuclease V gamma subunit